LKKIFVGIILLVSLVIFVVTLANYPKDKLDPELMQVSQNKAEFSPELTKVQSDALYRLLGIQYNDSLNTGIKIFNSSKDRKIVEQTYKKRFSHDEIKKNKTSKKMLTKYLDSNQYLSTKSTHLLQEMDAIIRVIGRVNLNTLKLYKLDIHEFKKTYFALLKHSYLSNNNIDYLKKYYEILFFNVLDNKSSLVHATLNLQVFKDVHNFIVSNNIDIDTENKKEKIKDINMPERYKSFVLNEIKYFTVNFFNGKEKQPENYLDHQLGFEFLDYEFLSSDQLKKIINNIFFDVREIFNIEYKYLNSDYKSCLEDPQSCESLNKKIFTISSPLSKLYAQESIALSIKGFNKYRDRLKKLL